MCETHEQNKLKFYKIIMNFATMLHVTNQPQLKYEVIPCGALLSINVETAKNVEPMLYMINLHLLGSRKLFRCSVWLNINEKTMAVDINLQRS